MVILVHLINNWQMNPHRKRTLLAALLLSTACIFSVTSAHADEPQVKDGAAAKPDTVFRDWLDCPEMVVIPAGSFNMGSPDSEKVWATKHGASPESVSDEAPQHRVTLRSFAIGKYDVTRGEYAVFVRETGYSTSDGCFESSMPKATKRADARWQSPGFNQTERDPAVCVSWQDARTYVSWLNGKLRGRGSNPSDGPYHLPSEAEWEYTARGGTTTPFWWGDDDTGATGHAWYKDNSDGHTHPVGSKPGNPFGLYDVVGNVWEWTEDCYTDSYAKAPTDGSAAESPNTCMRVDRGSCWLYPSWLLRSATRERNPADFRDVIMGVRVAKTLP